VLVRKAKIEDDRAMALIMAAVAQEGLIGAEPPVDIKARARRFRDAIEAEGSGASWVLDDAGRVVGNADVQERAPGVLYLGMAILPHARGRGGGRAFLDAILEHAQACGAHKIELEVWVDNARAIALYAPADFEVEGVRRDHYRRRGGGYGARCSWLGYCASWRAKTRGQSDVRFIHQEPLSGSTSPRVLKSRSAGSSWSATGALLACAARGAFMSGMQISLEIGALVALAGALLVLTRLPSLTAPLSADPSPHL
jgi:RimJ/RimL family protein N-acetyltransferase